MWRARWLITNTPRYIAFMNWLLNVTSFFDRWVKISEACGIRGIGDTVKGWELPRHRKLEDGEN